MKIVKLSSKNVKRLRAVEIAPDGNVVVVGGRNGQGKSSVLDSIAYALGGKDLVCAEPVRRGAKSAEIVCDLGDLIVRRTFTPDGRGSLTLESPDGARYTSPQSRLDDIIGRLSFDPLAFARMDPARQSDTLRAMLGLDFTALDRERREAFDLRTDVNREGKALRARYDSLPEADPSAPDREQSVAELIEELEIAGRHNRSYQHQRDAAAKLQAEYDAMERQAGAYRTDVFRLEQELESLRAVLKAHEAKAREARVRLDEALASAGALVDVSLDPIKDRIANLEETNRKVRANAENARILAELQAKRDLSAELTAKIDAVDERKRAMIAAAQFPVSGLGFGEDGAVTMNGLPFDQASSAEQLAASVAIGLALNPKLRVLLIRDGSLLDAESLALLGQMAATEDAQLWIERVEDGGATVVIEDGAVVSEPEVAS